MAYRSVIISCRIWVEIMTDRLTSGTPRYPALLVGVGGTGITTLRFLKAVALYSGWELPLTGVACALVDDIIVRPEHRGRGLAPRLQEFACARLRAAGLRWVAGNIDLDNPASMRQAQKAGRKPWTLGIRIEPEC